VHVIYLIRHGEIEGAGQKRFVGWTDLPLNATGIRQAYAWREFFHHKKWDAIYCSDLRRSIQTAQIIAGNQSERIDPLADIREINLGEWDGRLMEEIRNAFPEEWARRGSEITTYRPPGGESFLDLEKRVWPAFKKISGRRQSNVLMVAHAGVNRVTLCRVLGMPLENLFRIAQDYGALITIDQNRTPFVLTALNRSHAEWIEEEVKENFN